MWLNALAKPTVVKLLEGLGMEKNCITLPLSKHEGHVYRCMLTFRPNNLRLFSFHTGQAFFIPCSVQGNFYDELVFKTVGPLMLAAVIGSVQVLLRYRLIATDRIWPGTPSLLTLTYFVLTPATNAALRTLPCEVNMSLNGVG